MRKALEGMRGGWYGAKHPTVEQSRSRCHGRCASWRVRASRTLQVPLRIALRQTVSSANFREQSLEPNAPDRDPPSAPKVCPEAFPIKASDHSGVGTLLLLPSRGRVAAD